MTTQILILSGTLLMFGWVFTTIIRHFGARPLPWRFAVPMGVMVVPVYVACLVGWVLYPTAMVVLLALNLCALAFLVRRIVHRRRDASA